MILNRVQRRFETYGIQTITEQSQHVRDMMAVEDPVITSRAAEVYYEAAARNHLTLGAMERAIERPRPREGPQVGGPRLRGLRLRHPPPRVQADHRRVAAGQRRHLLRERPRPRGPARRADRRVQHDRCPRRTSASPSPRRRRRPRARSSLAADSGGFTVRNSNDLAAGLKRIADETRAYYLVGYNPTNTARDGAFRKIEVKVRGRRGLDGPRPQGLLRPLRHRARARAAAGHGPRLPGRARLARTSSRTSPCA